MQPVRQVKVECIAAPSLAEWQLRGMQTIRWIKTSDIFMALVPRSSLSSGLGCLYEAQSAKGNLRDGAVGEQALDSEWVEQWRCPL
jgi:hypothetical protein